MMSVTITIMVITMLTIIIIIIIVSIMVSPHVVELSLQHRAHVLLLRRSSASAHPLVRRDVSAAPQTMSMSLRLWLLLCHHALVLLTVRQDLLLQRLRHRHHHRRAILHSIRDGHGHALRQR